MRSSCPPPQGPKTMQASCAARATCATARTRPSRSRRRPCRRPSDGVTTRSQPNVTLYEPTGTRASRTSVAVEAGGAAPCRRRRSRRRPCVAREGDVLRRRAGGEHCGAGARRDRRARFAARRRTSPRRARPSGAKTTSCARNGGAIVRTSRGPARIARVEHRDRGRRVPERGPERVPVGADRDVARRARARACAQTTRPRSASTMTISSRGRVGHVRERRRRVHGA